MHRRNQRTYPRQDLNAVTDEDLQGVGRPGACTGRQADEDGRVDVWTAAGLILTSVSAVLAVPPCVVEWRRRRSHVRQVWVRLEPHLQPVGDDLRQRVRNGGALVVRNSGQQPVWNVIVMKPHGLAPMDFKSVGPGEVLTLDVPEAAMTLSESVTVQVTDNYQRTWRWTPLEQQLEPIPPKLSLLPRVVQRTARHWPESLQDGFVRLLKSLQRVLWGYDPSGEDDPSWLAG